MIGKRIKAECHYSISHDMWIAKATLYRLWIWPICVYKSYRQTEVVALIDLHDTVVNWK